MPEKAASASGPARRAKSFRTKTLLGLAVGLVTFLIITQATVTDTQQRYAGMRQDDLIQVLDGLQAESARLQAQIAELQRTRDALQSGADAAEVAGEEADRQLTNLSLLSGTEPAQGPGIRITISAPRGALRPAILLNAVQELKDAGAEVIEVNDRYRLGVDSWFGEDEQNLLIDGHPVELPLLIEVIGQPQSLAEGSRFRGGLVSQIESPKVGGSVQIEQLDLIEVDSVRELKTPKFARPA